MFMCFRSLDHYGRLPIFLGILQHQLTVYLQIPQYHHFPGHYISGYPWVLDLIPATGLSWPTWCGEVSYCGCVVCPDSIWSYAVNGHEVLCNFFLQKSVFQI